MEKTKTRTGLFGKKIKKELKPTKKSKLDNNFNDQANDFLIVDGILKKYNGNDTVVTIPNNMGINSIGQRAFFKRTDIRSITIPNGITSIANYAFSCCENLSSVTIGETVTFIGNYAFENCKSLTKIDLPGRLQSLGSYLFSGCTHLVDVTLPYELRSIGNYLFYKCQSLPKITIPDKVTSIGWKSFSGCSSLTEIKFPKQLSSIGNHAFENCTNLSTLHISDNITSIGEGVFFMCKGLSSLTIDDTNAAYKIIDGCLYNYDGSILYTYPSKLNDETSFTVPDGVKTICYGAFSSCINLREIVLPDSLEIIDNCAFFNCLNLQKINLGENIRSLGKNSFNNCYNLSEITLPDNIDTIETGVFSGCGNLTKVNMSDNITSIGEIAFFGCINLENFKFPKNLKSIGCAAFTNCQKLTEVNIHNNISIIAKGAFSHCKNLETINVSSENNEYSAKDGVLYTKDETCLLVYPSGKQDKTFTIPSNATAVNDQAFYGSIHLEEITIPSSVEDLGISAFSECPNLSKVTIEDGLTSIGTFVFSKNPNLSVVNLPKSISSIDQSAFLECEHLTFICSKDSFAYKYATIKNIPLYSDKPKNVNLSDQTPKKGLFKIGNKNTNTENQINNVQETNSINANIEENTNSTLENTSTSNDTNNNNSSLEDNNTKDSNNNDILKDSNTLDDDSLFGLPPIEHIELSVPTPNNLTTNQPNTLPLNDNIPVVNTKTFTKLNSVESKEVEYMSDITNSFNNISDANNTIGLNVSPDNYYNNEAFNKNPEFDNRYVFNGDPFDPFGDNPLYDLNSPNSTIGIQKEYSSPNKITNITVKQNSTSSVILSWDDYPNTSEYHLLHFNTKTRSYDDVCKLKTNKALLTGIIPSHIQQYKVAAYNTTKGKKELLASSNAVSVSTILPPVTGLEVIASTNDSLTFSWQPLADAINYIIYAYNTQKKCFVPVDETTNNYINFTNLDGIQSLKIKVAGISIINNIECMTELSKEIIGYTTIATVTNVVVSSYTSNSIKLSWSSIPNIDTYKIYAYNDKTARFEYVDTTPINQIVFNHLLPNKEYKFKIRAATYIDDVEVIGAPSDIISGHTTI